MANIFADGTHLLSTNFENGECCKMNKHETLLNPYGDFLSLDELSRVCKIAKRSARYLVVNGIIPAIDTGKRTWLQNRRS